MSSLFYSLPHFSILCSIFGYPIDYALKMINDELHNHQQTPKELAFIYIAFGDLTDIKSNTARSVNDKKMAREFMSKNQEFNELFDEYKKQASIIE